MRKIGMITAAAFVAAIFAGSAMAAGEYGKQQSQSGQSGMTGSQSGATSSQSGMSTSQSGQQQIRTASDIQKFNVQTAAGEKVGKVDKVVVDMQQGQIGYVIVSAAQGSDKYIIPWKALRPDAQQQNLILNMSASQLQQAPKGDIQLVQDRQKGREIHQFFGVSPYWEESGAQQRSQQQMQQMQQQQRDPLMQQREMERQRQLDQQQRTRPGTGTGTGM